MAEPRNEHRTPPHYEETLKRTNPPAALVSRSTRNLVFWSYLGPIIVLFVIIAAGFGFWIWRNASAANAGNQRTYAVGTTGTEGDNGYSTDYKPGSGPGGYDPQNVVGSPNRTDSELHRRGADGLSQGPNRPLFPDQPLTRVDAILQDPSQVAGRPVDISNVTVDSADGRTFWVRDAGMKVEVVAPAGSAGLKPGMRVHVVGTVEAGSNGRSRIRASRVDVTKK
jgi:hypothetical protein